MMGSGMLMLLTILATLLLAIGWLGKELSRAERRVLASIGVAGFGFILYQLQGQL